MKPVKPIQKLFFQQKASLNNTFIYMDENQKLFPATHAFNAETLTKKEIAESMFEMATGRFQVVALIPDMKMNVEKAIKVIEHYENGHPVAYDCNLKAPKHPAKKLNKKFPAREKEIDQFKRYLIRSTNHVVLAGPDDLTVKKNGLTPQ